MHFSFLYWRCQVSQVDREAGKLTLHLRAHEHCYCKTRANMERSHLTRNPRDIRGCEAADRLESRVKKCDPMTRVMK